MIQGCGSDVGKSVLTAGLCRVFWRRGIRVAPFKPQNMSNNAAVTVDGGEIGRAQALQALACGLEPHSDMNPVLLKPTPGQGAQLVVQGRVQGSRAASPIQAGKAALMQPVMESFLRLSRAHQLVLVEGAGSPAETNLRHNDIANMGFAHRANVPVVLVGDIDRGHVIAALVGTRAVLSPEDNAMIAGFIINKFRGDPSLFAAGRQEITRHTGWADMGLVPWTDTAQALPSEDAVVLQSRRKEAGGGLKVVVPLLPGIANFDDFDALRAEPGIDLHFLSPSEVLDARTELVILAGAKATIADLAFLRRQGWDIDILAHVRRGGQVIGICGGYQMLGRAIADPLGVEGPAGEVAGLGLLDIETRLTSDKTLQQAGGHFSQTGVPFSGYEIHVGQSFGPGLDRPWLTLGDGRNDGAISPDGRVRGTYVHGLFDHGAARRHILSSFAVASEGHNHQARTLEALDRLADLLEATLDIPALTRLSGLKGPA